MVDHPRRRKSDIPTAQRLIAVLLAFFPDRRHGDDFILHRI